MARTSVRVVLYGPQGQVREREELINVGQDNVPKGKTWYWLGANQPGRDLITLEKPPDTGFPRAQAALSIEHGLDTRTSVGLLARAMLVDDQRLTFVEGTVRRSVGGAMLEVSAARESNGGTAAHAQLLGKFGAVYVNVDALIANDFHLQGGDADNLARGARGARFAAQDRQDAGSGPRRSAFRAACRRLAPARGGDAPVGNDRPLQPRRRSQVPQGLCARGAGAAR